MNTNIINTVTCNDARTALQKIVDNSINLVYLDPPFFSQKEHELRSRSDGKKYSFEDKFSSKEEYISFMSSILQEIKRILKVDGSVFLHCDRYASHYLRTELDNVFGETNFQSEIIWSYKRWSNSKKGLFNII